jgi:hypothetical protein
MRLLVACVSAGLLGCSPSGGEPTDAAAEACAPLDVGPAIDAPVVTRAEIDDILRLSCSFSSCHGKNPGAGGLYLAPPPGNWVPSVLERPSSTHESMKLVVPGDPARSFFVQKLGSGLCALSKDCAGDDCGAQMPLGAKPLSDAEISKIVEWIRQGASDK